MTSTSEPDEDDYYAILGIELNATSVEIDEAYKTEALKWHPVKNAYSAKASRRFQMVTVSSLTSVYHYRHYTDNCIVIFSQIDDAFTTLANIIARLNYDEDCYPDVLARVLARQEKTRKFRETAEAQRKRATQSKTNEQQKSAQKEAPKSTPSKPPPPPPKSKGQAPQSQSNKRQHEDSTNNPNKKPKTGMPPPQQNGSVQPPPKTQPVSADSKKKTDKCPVIVNDPKRYQEVLKQLAILKADLDTAIKESQSMASSLCHLQDGPEIKVKDNRSVDWACHSAFMGRSLERHKVCTAREDVRDYCLDKLREALENENTKREKYSAYFEEHSEFLQKHEIYQTVLKNMKSK